MRILVTGAGGFAGSFLMEALIQEGYEVHGVISPQGDRRNLQGVACTTNLYPVDLCNKNCVLKLLEKIQPEGIFQLASLAVPSRSFNDAQDVLQTNTTIVVNLFEALKTLSLKPRILFISSCDIYAGDPNESLTETAEALPFNPYGISKYSQELLCMCYERAYGIRSIRVRPFAYTGPRQKDIFAIPSFAHQIAQIEGKARQPVIQVGNLQTVRDYSDVRDIVRGYLRIFEHGKEGEVYNLSSGKGVTMQEILNQLLALATVPIRIEIDSNRLRPFDVPRSIGDHSKVSTETEWEPKFSLHQTLTDTLSYWRAVVSEEKKETNV